jgi:hypothetical protein
MHQNIGISLAALQRAANMEPGRRVNAIGLADDVEDAMAMKIALLPSLLVATQTNKLPLTPDEIKARFGQVVSYLDGTQGIQQSTGITGSGFISGASPVAPFLVRALAVVGVCEPFSFALRGAGLVARDPSTATPAFNGVVPLAGLGSANDRPASFEFGAATARAFADFLNSYQFRYTLNGRFLLVNERASDIGVVDTHQSICGFGTGQIPASPWIRLANDDRLKAVTGRIFIPQTVDANGAAVAEPIVDVQLQQLCAPGIFGGSSYPVMPHVLFPGQQYSFTFERQINEEAYHDRLVQDLGNQGVQSYASDLLETIAGGPSPGYAASIALKYGLLRIGIMVRGYELTPWACIQWWFRYGRPYMSMYGTDKAVMMQMEQMATSLGPYGLSGLPVPLGEADGEMLGTLAKIGDEQTEAKRRAATIKLMNASRANANSAMQEVMKQIAMGV